RISAYHMCRRSYICTTPHTSATYTLSLHDALPIWPLGAVHALLGEERRHTDRGRSGRQHAPRDRPRGVAGVLTGQPLRRVHDQRSEEHTSELQSRENLVCRLLLEKKNKAKKKCKMD